jgi:hypothetical protein
MDVESIDAACVERRRYVRVELRGEWLAATRT